MHMIINGRSCGLTVCQPRIINNNNDARVATGLTAAVANATEICRDDGDEVEFEWEHMQLIITIVVPMLFGLICILSIVGNSLVIVVIAANPSMRSTTNILITNLAIADLLFAVFCIPFTATDYVLPYWIFGDTWCRIVQYLIIVTACASIYTLVLMSFDRYLAVVHPVASMSMRTKKRACIAIGIIWIVILVLCIPVLLTHGEYEPPPSRCNTEPNQPSCRILPNVNWPLFQLTFFGASYLMPLTLICSLYLLMLTRLWETTDSSNSGRRRSRKKVTKLILVVVGVFALCWLPIQVILVLKSLGMYTMVESTVALQVASHSLAYMNSCVNPILYAFLNDNFCQAFRKVIYRKSRQNSTSCGG